VTPDIIIRDAYGGFIPARKLPRAVNLRACCASILSEARRQIARTEEKLTEGTIGNNSLSGGIAANLIV